MEEEREERVRRWGWMPQVQESSYALPSQTTNLQEQQLESTRICIIGNCELKGVVVGGGGEKMGERGCHVICT